MNEEKFVYFSENFYFCSMDLKIKVKTMAQQLLRSPREFPVEAAMGVVFFLIAALHTSSSQWAEKVADYLQDDVLVLFVPLIVLTFRLHRVNSWAYRLAGLLFIPLMALDLRPFLFTYGFGFTYVLAAILLVAGTWRMDNRSFAAHALHVVTMLFFGVVISGLLTLAVMAIVASFFYIFDITQPVHLYEYILEFIWFAIAPQVCCSLISHDEDKVKEPSRVLTIILNFILTPAVIIYAVIFYVYFIKIALEWDLPKGGVAWMVMGFITVALIGRLMQYVLSQRYYDWFYRRFPLIAVAPLILYWIGSVYRIRLYSFTESRFYLMVAGLLMTLFVMMLLWRRSRRFQLMALIFGAAIILFTYIPGISAKSIGLRCQTARMERLMRDLKLIDKKTGKLVAYVDVPTILKDSLQCNRYQDVCSVIDYVREDMGKDEFTQQYGVWDYNDYQFVYNKEADVVADEGHILDKPVALGEYNIMIPAYAYSSDFTDGTLTVMMNEKIVLAYPIDSIANHTPEMKNHPEKLHVYKNDSLLVVLNQIYVSNKEYSTNGNVISLFRRQRK